MVKISHEHGASSAVGLSDYSANKYSQNGEDGIIARVFSIIGPGEKRCCEFGSWDGIHLSNTRALIESGWSGALIECDSERFNRLEGNTRQFQNVATIRACVDTTTNRLSTLLKRAGFPPRLDFLSIDVDGLDYELFIPPDDIRPRLILVEVNACHDPNSTAIVPRELAANCIGQPLRAFVSAADEAGYRLICYTGNAFFLRRDEGKESELPTLTPQQAYSDFLSHVSRSVRRWIYLSNLGLVPPYYCFKNPLLTSSSLNMSILETARAYTAWLVFKIRRGLSRFLRIWRRS